MGVYKSRRKQPKAKTPGSIGDKRPHIAAQPNAPGAPLVWQFASFDRNGPYAWSGLSDASHYKKVMEKLHQFETMQETERRAQGSHPVPINNISKSARDRLFETERDDAEELMSFRVSGRERVWCLIDRNIMVVLWWDPRHEVCPSLKKNT